MSHGLNVLVPKRSAPKCHVLPIVAAWISTIFYRRQPHLDHQLQGSQNVGKEEIKFKMPTSTSCDETRCMFNTLARKFGTATEVRKVQLIAILGLYRKANFSITNVC